MAQPFRLAVTGQAVTGRATLVSIVATGLGNPLMIIHDGTSASDPVKMLFQVGGTLASPGYGYINIPKGLTFTNGIFIELSGAFSSYTLGIA